MSLSVNFPKASSSRTQAWLRFCLNTYKNAIEYEFHPSMWSKRLDITWSLFSTYKDWAIGSIVHPYNKWTYWQRKTFINNNTFSGCLHSKGAVLHDYLSLLKNMPLYQPLKWFDMVLPNWVLAFPMLSSMQCPELSSIPSHQALGALALPWHYNLAWVCVSSMPIGPLHFPFFLQ